jgi:transcriptional regulator with XRE-family HTH domain
MVNRYDRGREQELRKEQGWTQLERGNKLGVPPVTVDTWMRGQHVSTGL